MTGSFVFSLLALGIVSPVRAASNLFIERPPIVRHLKAHVEIERGSVRLNDSRNPIRFDQICQKDLYLPVVDVRGEARLRPQADTLDLECIDHQALGATKATSTVRVIVQGRAEWLRPADMDGWMKGHKDLLRLFFTLESTTEDSKNPKTLPAPVSWEFFSQDLQLSQAAFRLSPAEPLKIVCDHSKCESSGPRNLYRARVDLQED